MDIENYFISLTNELISLKNRVRHYIATKHWLSDGEWKESVIRSVLKRHLPNDIGVGRGFVVNSDQVSTQIDILLYDRTEPILFQDGDFVIITPSSFKGAIEVKTKFWQYSTLIKAINKLSDIAQFVNPKYTYGKNQFVGLFSYEKPNLKIEKALAKLQFCVNGQRQRIINCISFGENHFIRYWRIPPNSPGVQNYDMWHAYYLPNKAPAYFIHNVIDHLCPNWASKNNEVLYPIGGKENCKIAERFLYLPEQIT